MRNTQQHHAPALSSPALFTPAAHPLAMQVGQPARDAQQHHAPAAVPAQAPPRAASVLRHVTAQRGAQVAARHVLRLGCYHMSERCQSGSLPCTRHGFLRTLRDRVWAHWATAWKHAADMLAGNVLDHSHEHELGQEQEGTHLADDHHLHGRNRQSVTDCGKVMEMRRHSAQTYCAQLPAKAGAPGASRRLPQTAGAHTGGSWPAASRPRAGSSPALRRPPAPRAAPCTRRARTSTAPGRPGNVRVLGFYYSTASYQPSSKTHVVATMHDSSQSSFPMHPSTCKQCVAAA